MSVAGGTISASSIVRTQVVAGLRERRERNADRLRSPHGKNPSPRRKLRARRHDLVNPRSPRSRRALAPRAHDRRRAFPGRHAAAAPQRKGLSPAAAAPSGLPDAPDADNIFGRILRGERRRNRRRRRPRVLHLRRQAAGVDVHLRVPRRFIRDASTLAPEDLPLVGRMEEGARAGPAHRRRRRLRRARARARLPLAAVVLGAVAPPARHLPEERDVAAVEVHGGLFLLARPRARDHRAAIILVCFLRSRASRANGAATATRRALLGDHRVYTCAGTATGHEQRWGHAGTKSPRNHSLEVGRAPTWRR